MVRTRMFRLTLAMVCAGGFVVGLAGPAGATDPPGNNGTVKIDRLPFDDHPDNEPHVGCEFQVDFYGFDEGDLSASVRFEAIPPTVPEGTVPPGSGVELLVDELAIGEDSAGGGTDLDASGTYDLSDAVAGIEAHPQQGWHVRLTVNAEGSQGADTKHKVFWVRDCGPTTTTTTPGSTTTTMPHGSTTTSSSTTTTPGGTTTPPTTGGPSSSVSPSPSPSASSSTTLAAAEGDMPETGSNATMPLVVGALALLTIGATGVGVARRLRHAAPTDN